MRISLLLALLPVADVAVAVAGQMANPLIDYATFRDIVVDSQADREAGRLSEAQFAHAMREPGVVVLDARSADRYALRHIAGAINLPFTDFTEESLAAVIPSKDATILIYCNNNFIGSPSAFPTKAIAASLNLSTQAALRAYGYSRIYELGPALDVSATALPFAGTEVAQTQPPRAAD